MAPRGYVYARLGRHAEATAMLDLLGRRRAEQPGVSLTIDGAIIAMGAGDHDRVFGHLGRAVEERLGAAVYLNISRIWEPLHSDPRWAELVRSTGLPAAGADALSPGTPG